jgi:uncharacterized protein
MQKVFFHGPAGWIEGLYNKSSSAKSPIALILHPDPLHGGNMNSKVVYNIYKALAACGFAVLKINFRGVGNSTKQSDLGPAGELSDGALALDWLQDQNPDNNLTLIAGFSFGAWIAMQLIMRRPEIRNFIAVSPPVNKYDFSSLSPCPCNGLIVQGDQDSIVPEKSVSEFAGRINVQKNVSYQVIQGADHFFRNKNTILEETIKDYIQTHVFKQEENTAKKKIASKLYL